MSTTSGPGRTNRGNLKPSSNNNPCPICGRTKDGDCRISDDGRVFCHTHTGEGFKPGDPAPGEAPYRFIGTSTGAHILGMWRPAADWTDRARPPRRTQTPMPRRTPAAFSPQPRPRAIPAEITLPTKLIRPQGHASFQFALWDGTPVEATKVRIDHGNGQAKAVSWRPALSKEGFTQADLAPWNWHRAVAAHQQDGCPFVVLKGELKAQWLNDRGVTAISINGWDPFLEQQLKHLGDAVVLAPDCDLADLRDWYAKAAAALPHARHLLVPGANWAQPPATNGVGIDDWLQSQPAITAQEILQAVTAEGWGGQDRPASRERARCRRIRPDEALELLPERLGTLRLNVRTREVETDNGTLAANQSGRMYLRLSNEEETWHKETTADAIAELAAQNSYDPVAEYLNGLEDEPLPLNQWKRLDRYLLGIDDPIAAAFLPRYLISAVARALDPGCSVRQIPVLVGPQWRGKTALGRVLFGATQWVEGIGRLDRDDLMKAGTAWGVELAELDGVTRRSDQEHLKAFLTETVDTYRAPYDRAPERHPRRFVFWATSNGPPLRDATGSTRFVCIHLPDRMLPLEWADEHRSAIWARAVEQYRAGVHWDSCSEDERRAIAARNADFQELDPLSDRVASYLKSRQQGGMLPVRIPEVLDHLDVPVERQSNQWSKRIRQLAESSGWKYDRCRPGSGGEKVRGLWPGPPGPPVGRPLGHPQTPGTAMDLTPWATRTTQLEKSSCDVGEEEGGAVASAYVGTFQPGGWPGRPRPEIPCSTVDLSKKAGGPAGGPAVCAGGPVHGADPTAAMGQVFQPGPRVGRGGGTETDQAAATGSAHLRQEPATQSDVIDTQGLIQQPLAAMQYSTAVTVGSGFDAFAEDDDPHWAPRPNTETAGQVDAELR